MSEFDGRREAAPGSVDGGRTLGYLPLLPTLCVAACLAAGSLYWRDAPPRPPAGQAAAAAPRPVPDPFRTAEAGGEALTRHPLPLEFARQFPLAVSSALAAEARAPAEPAAAGPLCEALPAAAPEKPLPLSARPAPRRPASPRHALQAAQARPSRPAALQAAEAGPEETPPTERASFAGLALPRVVETGRVMVRHVSALGAGVVQAGSAMLDLIDRHP
ncbi:hypothetical protein M446_3740 [Methylobacterium sp. 4-46]|uniref:hypothetical protein n=1 Tax=unclassified Methylobacterium TaxID=2615210 RepID=UPI000152C6BD|nr:MULTISPECIES: hypothetical protein [Methylobacterium]ACA18120.1 hypothetical protein M446_3740 [Methylobacterium sp. 4-46]WFT77418.1 hypothetical protein QA634_18970 [Methylobacterium nodulans]